MPLNGQGNTSAYQDDAPFFGSLEELDLWVGRPAKKLTGVVPYRPRSILGPGSQQNGRLLVSKPTI
jgi:hypothetical protein